MTLIERATKNTWSVLRACHRYLDGDDGVLCMVPEICNSAGLVTPLGEVASKLECNLSQAALALRVVDRLETVRGGMVSMCYDVASPIRREFFTPEQPIEVSRGAFLPAMVPPDMRVRVSQAPIILIDLSV